MRDVPHTFRHTTEPRDTGRGRRFETPLWVVAATDGREARDHFNAHSMACGDLYVTYFGSSEVGGRLT